MNAWRGCPGEARPKRKTDPELCVRCMKSGRGRILTSGEGGNRWGMTCANASTVVGTVLGCRGRLYKREEHRKLCAPCFVGRKGAPSDLQRRWALAKREQRRQKKEQRTQKECVVPEVTKLHVLTVQSNFARLTFHGVKYSSSSSSLSTSSSSSCDLRTVTSEWFFFQKFVSYLDASCS